MTRTRLLLYRTFLVVATPILTFVVLELSLRLVGFGYTTDVFVEKGGIVRTNWAFTFNYFPWSMSRPMEAVQFTSQKAPDTIRVFVLGGSAAQGFPDESFGLSRQLRVMLEQAYPDKRVEVINAAITAVNSHVMLPVARACLAYDPDWLVVYLGNNEVVGPHGAGTVFGGFSSRLSMIRMSDRLKGLRLYQMLVLLTGKHQAPTGTWQGMEAFLDNTVSVDDRRLETVYKHFATNLHDMINAAARENCPVVLSTVGVNLLDNPPFASTKPKQAEEEYLRGLTLLNEGKLEEGKDAVQNARDWDALRFRADSNINRVIREVASQHEGEVVLVDSEQALEESEHSRFGLPGEALFYDHVHLSFAGNYTVSNAMAEAIVSESESSSQGLPSIESVAESLAFTPWDRIRISRQLAEQLMNKPPFTNQWNHQRRHLSQKRELRNLIRRAEGEALNRSRVSYEAASEDRPDDAALQLRWSRLLVAMGDQNKAAEVLEAVLAKNPLHYKTLVELASLRISMEEFDKADSAFSVIFKENPYAIEVRNAYLQGLFKAKNYEQAIRYCESLVEDHPADPDVRYVYSLILNAQGQKLESIRQLREVLNIDPGHAEANGALIDALISAKNEPQALGAARDWVKASPESAQARFRFAELLLRKPDHSGASEELKAALESDPDFIVARSRYIQSMAQQGRIHEAIQFLGMQLRDDPNILDGHSMLGLTLDAAGRKEQGIALLRIGLQRETENVKCLRELAWILATARSEQYRNGVEAVELAERLVRLSPQNPDFLNVLAAAYAETGQFTKAVTVAEGAFQVARTINNRAQIEIIQTCLEAYKKGQPLRTD